MRVRARSRGLWWVSPLGCLLMVVPLSLSVAVLQPDRAYRLYYREPKLVTPSVALLVATAAAALALGSLLPQAVAPAGTAAWAPRWGRFSPEARRMLLRASSACWWATVFGYSVYTLLGFARGARPALLLEGLKGTAGASDQVKALFRPVTGVTTLTQVGIAYAVIAALLLADAHDRRTRRRLVVLVVISALRAFVLSERLALLEVVVPLLCLGAVVARRRARRGWLVPAAPALFLPALLVVFGAFEYSRSWAFFRTRTTEGFPVFVVNRLAGYYATSYNNGALLLAHRPVPAQVPYDTLEGLWTAPGVAQAHLYLKLNQGVAGGDLFGALLQQHSNPEFNNPGGLTDPLVDWGTRGGLVYLLLLGVLVGLVFRAFRQGSPVGLLLYPPLFTGLLEVPRYLYFVQGRLVPGLAVLALVGWRLSVLERRQRVRAALAARAVPPGGYQPTTSERAWPSTVQPVVS